MATIKEYAAVQKEFNARTAAGVDGLVTAITGITGDVKSIKDKLDQLQNNPGPISPEDQALLDDLQAEGAAAVAKLEGVVQAAKDLDAQTENPPVPPQPV